MPKQDINRSTTNVLMPAEVSDEIWAKTLEGSAIMQLAQQIPMPGSGTKFQTITGEPVAEWVDETNPKPVSRHTFGTKTVTPYKMAVIEPFSMEFRRDKAALYEECVNRLPYSLSRLFDATVMGTVAPGDGFDVLGGCTKVSLIPGEGGSVYGQFLAAHGAIAAADGVMSGIALAPQGESFVLGAVDGVGHPVFTAGVGSDGIGSILGATVQVAKGVYVAGSAGDPGTPAIVGLAGDFAEARYGYVSGIEMSVTEQASIEVGSGDDAEVLHLWQRNMFAVRFECEVGFLVRDPAKFVLLTGTTPTE